MPLVLVILWVIYRHAGFGFSKDVTGFVTKPFFQDHTIYSAAIAFLLPFALLKVWNSDGFSRITALIIAFIMLTALFLAVSRAAWISVGAAVVLWLVIKSRAPSPVIGLIFFALAVFLYARADDMLFRIKSNRYDSGARNANLAEQTKSVLNITNDQSNAERLNRWKCALRMFREKPFTGFGPRHLPVSIPAVSTGRRNDTHQR